MKKALISVISALLFASCSFLNQPVGEYFSYWGSEVFVTTSIVKVPNQNDSEGIISVASDKNAEVILNIANPKNFNLVMPSADNTEMIHFNAFDPQPVFGVDYMIEKLSSKELKLTYTAQFLKKHEWGQKDLGATLTMFADDGREFKKNYTFKIKSNTKPPQPSVILAQTNESTPHYVLCLTVPDMDAQVNGKKLHKDIAQIVINESSYELKINDSGLDFVKPMDESFITRTEVTQLTTHGAEAVPTGNWTLFYKTDRQVGSAYKEYTVTLKDQRGLSSEKLETGTTINKPAEETVTLNAGTQESGSGTNALPFIIQAAGTKPEAKLIISCTSSGTTVHCTVTDVSTGTSSEYNGNPANVPLGLNGENEKLYEVKYNTKGYGYNPTTLKTKYYKILKLHTVTFNANGGKFADDSTAKTETVLHGRTVTAPSASPTRVGNVFVGWYKEEDGTNEWNFTDDTIRSNTIIYAKWSDKAVEIKSDEDGAWKKLKEEAAKTSGVSVIVIEGEIKATTDSSNSGEITIGRNLTIQGKTGATTDKLDANGQNHRIFKVTGGKTLTLKNLTLTKGKPDISDEGSNGGAIFAKGGTLNMTNCEVKGNKADNGGGGGIYATDDGSTVSSVTISDSTIGGTGADKNESGSNDSGGGICIGYGCSLTMKNTKVIGNKSDLSGGGIYAGTNSTLSMEHCTVSGNTAANGSGGGIHAEGVLTMTGCTVSDNETTGDSGGGVYVSGTAEIKGGSTIYHNQAAVSGGGIYMASGSVTLINATIGGDQYYDDTDPDKSKGNKAIDSGGGIYVASGTLSIKDSTLSFNKSTSGTGGGIKTDNSTLTMTDCTLTHNKAGNGGGGILTSGTSSLTMETCTLTDNVANFNGGGGVYASGNAFTMTDCTLTGNVANNNGGGAVYVAEGTFTMKGSSCITPSSAGDANVAGKNDVYLKNGKMITVPEALTGTTPVARITPAAYNSTTQVLTGGAVSSEHAKFTVTPTTVSGGTQIWTIKNDGYLQKPPITIKGTDSLAWKKLKDAVAAADDGDIFTIIGEIKATNDTDNSGELEISKNLTIKGRGVSATLDANNGNHPSTKHRIFKVASGKTLTLQDLMLKGGEAGNYNASDPLASSGGAILLNGGSASLSKVTISGCKAITTGGCTGQGGGIYAKDGGTLTLNNSKIQTCEATASGGAICATGGTINLTGCTITGNKANNGGAIHINKTGGGDATLIISGGKIGDKWAGEPNTASGTSGNGGGIYVEGSSCTVTLKDGVQVIGNTADEGGGIFAKGGSVELNSCTIKNNTGTLAGGGICARANGSTPANVTINGGVIGGTSASEANKTGSSGKGGGIFVSGANSAVTLLGTANVIGNTAKLAGGGVFVDTGSVLNMQGSAIVTPSTGSDANAPLKNDVYLMDGCTIKLSETLSGAVPVARITPAAYNTTTQVLTGGAVSSEHGKFTVTPKDLGSGNTQQWEINSTGFLQKTPVVINGSGDAWKKLKDAVAAANDDDVFIIDGEIKAKASSGGKIEIKKNLTIRGKSGADSDILNANRVNLSTNAHSIFDMDRGKTLKLENLTLKGGKGIAGGTLGGGAILIPSGGGTTAELSDCVIEDCQAEKGGAIGCGKGGTVKLTNTTIKKCKASGSGSDSGGGAIFAQGATVEMTDCTLTGNEAKSGGAIYAVKKDSTASTVTISGGTIGGTGEGEANKATGNGIGSDGGGGIYIGETCTLTMQNSAQVIGNTATFNGAGIYTKGTLIMESCTITDNKTIGANNNTGGGGVYVESGSVEIKDATKIYHNYTDASGGGIYVNDGTVTLKDATIGGEQLYDGTDSGKTKGNKAQFCGGIYVKNGTINMENCTLSSNTARNGGGIQADNGNLTVKDCILTNNEADFYGGGIYVTGGSLTLNNTTIGGEQFYDSTDSGKTKGNKAKSGGGLYIEGNGTSVTMNGGSIQYNKTIDGKGGGVYIKGEGISFTMNGGKITQCKADVTSPSSHEGRGGGIYIYGDNASSPINITIKGTAEISHNESTCQGTASGGGIYGESNSIITVSENATIKNNKAKGFGGGVYIKDTFKFTGGTITENTASLGAGIFSEKSSTTLEMSGNARVTNDNDIYLYNNGVITITGGALTGTPPVARITVLDNKYLTSTQVLAAGAGVTLANETYKFAVTPQTSTAQPWTVGGNGFLKQGRYTEVPYGQLEAYLANNASSTEVNYIEVTGISAADLTGSYGSPPAPGALGQKIKAADPKKVALKLPDGLSVTDMSACFSQCENLVSLENFPSGVTDMRACFYGCENLTTVPAIPATVTSMMECFRYCRSLTTVPNIPSEVYDMTRCFQYCEKLQSIKMNCPYRVNFSGAFSGCDALPNGGIKVSSLYLAIYKNNAGTMGTTKEKFAGF